MLHGPYYDNDDDDNDDDDNDDDSYLEATVPL